MLGPGKPEERLMGEAKKAMEQSYRLEQQAMAVLLRVGAVSECPVHDGIFIDEGDSQALEEAYAVAARKVQSGNTKATLAEYTAAIDEALATAGEHCPICSGHSDE